MRTKLRCSKVVTVALWVLLSSAVSYAAEIRMGLVLDKGGKDDKSFNQSAYQGLMKAKKEFNIVVKYVEATDDNAFEPLLRAFAQKKFDLIIAIGVSQVDAVKKIASEPEFRNQKFALVDGEVKAPNVRSLIFDEHEGSFLVGSIAALASKTGKVGFIGGMDIALIHRFAYAFEAGAKYVKPKIKVTSNYIGVTPDAWNNPAKEKELAVSQYDSGVDVIFSAAGASGTGLFDAAEEKKKFAIGVDSNQDHIKPGYVLTSMEKKVDEAIYSTCKDFIAGKFTGGTQRFGLSNMGVGYTLDQYNAKILTPAIQAEAEKIKAGIIAGKIKVPDYYKIQR